MNRNDEKNALYLERYGGSPTKRRDISLPELAAPYEHISTSKEWGKSLIEEMDFANLELMTMTSHLEASSIHDAYMQALEKGSGIILVGAGSKPQHISLSSFYKEIQEEPVEIQLYNARQVFFEACRSEHAEPPDHKYQTPAQRCSYSTKVK